ncbi:MAG: DUF5596 domain-containing protein [Ruminococcaceae bacterium]|nr:DUF5596 domain-containing protein [Oscillospiraceae bacterium]
MKHIHEIINRLALPEEAVETFYSTYDAVQDSAYFRALSGMIADGLDFQTIQQKCSEYAQSLQINKYILGMTLLLANTHVMKKRFMEKGIAEDVFWESITDYEAKVDECHKMHGVWGIFAFGWYEGFFAAKLFRLGRLEYVERSFKNGVRALAIHIPSGSPLTHDAVLASYKRAYDFFHKTLGKDIAFTCSSYLLFPDYMGAVFAAGTNLYQFAGDYHILHVNETTEFSNAWRVFYKDYQGDVSVLPTNTSLQRAFVKHLASGGKSGTALGAFFFNGERFDKAKAETLRPYL